jgi:hypothetical protein
MCDRRGSEDGYVGCGASSEIKILDEKDPAQSPNRQKSTTPEGPLHLRSRVFLSIHGGRANRSRGEKSRARDVDRGGAVERYDTARFGCAGEVGSQSIGAVLLTQVPPAPNASANPDANDGDNHDDEEDDPLVVSLNPGVARLARLGLKRLVGERQNTHQVPPPPLCGAAVLVGVGADSGALISLQ